MSATRDNLVGGIAWSNDRQRCGVVSAPRKTTTVPKVLRPVKGDPRWRTTEAGRRR